MRSEVAQVAGIPLRRGQLEGLALHTYVPRRGRGGRHYADAFSVALWLSKVGLAPRTWATDMAELLVDLVPPEARWLAYPPAGRKRRARGFYLAAELATAIGAALGLPVLEPLRWCAGGGEDSKALVHHAGKGRALGRKATCSAELAGEVVALVDDLWTTGITAEACAEALCVAGAGSVFVVALAVTEDTKARPSWERARIRARQEANHGRSNA